MTRWPVARVASDLHPRGLQVKQPISEYRDSALWSALHAIFAELVATREITINTGPDYVTAHVCRELVAKKVVTESALRPRHETKER